MVWKSVVRKRENRLTLASFSQMRFIVSLSVCLLWFSTYVNAETQSPEKMDVGIKLSEKGVIVTEEDFKKAKIRDEEVKVTVSKSIEEINSSIANIERDAKTMSTHLENLQQEKIDYAGKDVGQKFLELLGKEIAIVQEKIDIDHEQIETYKDRIEVLRDQSKAHDEIVVLLKSILGLEEILLTSHEHAPIVKKEAEIAKKLHYRSASWYQREGIRNRLFYQ